MADVHVYVDSSPEREDTALEDLAEALKKLDHVSDVGVNSPGNVVAVSFEWGRAEQEVIERAVEETAYAISRFSARTTIPEDRHVENPSPQPGILVDRQGLCDASDPSRRTSETIDLSVGR